MSDEESWLCFSVMEDNGGGAVMTNAVCMLRTMGVSCGGLWRRKKALVLCCDDRRLYD